MAQCYDRTWATLVQSKIDWHCKLLVVLKIGGYKAHYYYNTITHSETKVDGTIIIVLALLYLN